MSNVLRELYETVVSRKSEKKRGRTPATYLKRESTRF